MAGTNAGDQLSVFLKSGFYRFDHENAVFIDPVRVFNQFYSRFTVSRSAYYSRFFPSTTPSSAIENHNVECTISKKRKRRKKLEKRFGLNTRESIAVQRHQELRPILVAAHEALLRTEQLLAIIRNLRNDERNGDEAGGYGTELDFVELGRVWQAPFFEITLNRGVVDDTSIENTGVETCDRNTFSLFDNIVVNERSYDVEADLCDRRFILPKRSGFLMSDIRKIRKLIPAESICGFSLIVIDPPWENSSAHQKLKYQTLPNRHFLSLPIKQLTHKDGALLALWVTNREKLHSFVKDELFPKWGVVHAATFYWLKVKGDGSMIGELDLFHHRPYECLLLGFIGGEDISSEQLLGQSHFPDNQVFISVPGDYSRKPPIGELLLDYAPGCKPTRCIELFSREILSGWTSWGNEPLHFQDSRYFLSSITD